ncbi:MAG: hypothetical protein Salg2KO_10250 [Salibacteraceae bacterium]
MKLTHESIQVYIHAYFIHDIFEEDFWFDMEVDKMYDFLLNQFQNNNIERRRTRRLLNGRGGSSYVASVRWDDVQMLQDNLRGGRDFTRRRVESECEKVIEAQYGEVNEIHIEEMMNMISFARLHLKDDTFNGFA